ncbi:MAG TPA: hypothetical protein DDX92_07970 [Flavobacteriales bacterium]|jgi:hypothetical protein|nr:hypothetical protein [Flavobacteriales bacterium]
MKTYILLALAVVAFIISPSTAQDLPQPSPMASFTQTVGVTEISMEYSRPGVKDREIWGALVPYGELWRTGANASTKIEFNTDVQISGKEVPAGSYALFVIPGESEMTFILNTHTTGWGTDGYKEENDIVRVTGKVMESAFTERMLFVAENMTDNMVDIALYWADVKVSFPISINTDELADKVVKEMIKDADGSFRKYNNAARWYLTNDGDKAQALEWAQKSVDQDKRFWNLTVLSEAQAANGDYKTAIKTAEEAIEMAKKADYQPYIDRNEKNIAEWKGMK